MSVLIVALVAMLCLSCSNTSNENAEPAAAKKVNKNPNQEKVTDFTKDATQNRKIGKQLVLEDIVGTWVLTDEKIGGTRTVKYNKDNTFRAVVNVKSEEYIDEGIWRVSGDQIKFKRKGNNIEVATPVEVNGDELTEKYYNTGKEERKVYSRVE